MNLTPESLVSLVCVLIFALIAFLFLRFAKKEAEKGRKKEEESKKREEADMYGNTALARLRQAASKNKVANVQADGKISPRIGFPRLDYFKQHSGEYIIFADIPDSRSHDQMFGTGHYGHNLFQLGINSGKERSLRLFWSPKGPIEYYPISDFEKLASRLEKYLENYKFFQQGKEV
ncbi:MAG TPA: hypothetical protein DIT25_00330 [Candidatus Moranbacteria bacterium]|nr:hypothetical protein [Candidatus Moranbacteria bacterium]